MSFTDPLSLTVSSVTTPLPRTFAEGSETHYSSADGLIVVSASHDVGKRTRRLLRVDYSKLSPDAFKPDENVKRSMSLYMVFDIPADGFTNAEVLAVYQGYKAMITATSDQMVTKLLGGES
ncbi:coat protein [ssRNA phage Esthiorhiza.2_8]|uniref:Coat protein n=2 Tax=Leviviricetes TaxID=2842243 RepID=A0A8S5L3A9_9VIRU|nr:coat protein [ssRNA phage Esthiorhiza.2_8]QDH90183.1 MAG: hypothetical protein H2RhizoLitter491120_000004 [Leviviridae sp.]DAD51658.1 TPA_asm: coat protein [ssRNA phage Esthiorhiza.2_8]